MPITTGADLATVLDRVRGYVIDMDGVLYRGDAAVPYAREFVDLLDARGVPYIMATNNSTRTPAQYVEKLAQMGISTTKERIFTSGMATRAWLDERYPPGTRVYVIGMDALRTAIFAGDRFQPAAVDADVVVCGADWDLTFDKLRIGTLAIRRGATFVATNPDTTFPSEEGLIPGAGAILAALVAASGVEPIVIGKPQTGMLLEGAEFLGLAPSETAMLGDRIDTDIVAGRDAGFITLLVLTGVTRSDDLERIDIHPDVVVEDLEPLVAYYQDRR